MNPPPGSLWPRSSMNSENASISMYPPLLLIDDVPVLHEQSFLSVDPARIRRIEVINDLYIKGDMIFGGLINLRSVRGDMAAVDLPEGSYFFDYQTFSRGSLGGKEEIPSRTGESAGNPGSRPAAHAGTGGAGSSGTGGTESIGNGRIPDTRNTLLWIDRLRLGPEETKSIRFRAAPSEGDYLILLRGVNAEGQPVQVLASFRVER